MYMKYLSIIVILIVFLVSCKNKSQETHSKGGETDKVSLIAENKSKNTDFENILLAINTIELPDTIICGVDSSVPVEEYGNELVQIAPKPSEETRIYGKLPSKGGMEYIIYVIPGDINFPYLYTYSKDGQLIDSIYLHIGTCLADESVVISNITIINNDYSLNMTDTTKHVHYNEENKQFIDSVIVTKRYLDLNSENKYQILKTETSRALPLF